MIRWLSVPFLLPLVACNLSQELQGSSAPDAGTPGHEAGAPSADGSIPPGQGDGGGSDASPTSDATPIPPTSNVSICVPQPQMGAASIVVNGSQPYVGDVTGISFGAADVYAFSEPFGFYGVPLQGGTVEDLSPTATLPSLIAAAVGPAQATVAGTLTSQSVFPMNLPSGQGTLFGLKGPAGGEVGVIPGQIAVDGSDVFFWTDTPSQLVQASLVGAPERVIAQYSAGNTTVTAMGFDSTYLYFATSDAVLRRTLRSGGAISDLATLPAVVDGILIDGGTLYLPQASPVGTGHADFDIWSYDLGTGTATQVVYLPLILARTTPVSFDGTAFYWGASDEGDCLGTLMRLDKSALQGPAQTLVQHLDVPLALRLSSGNAYVGTESAPFRHPLTEGQLLLWTP